MSDATGITTSWNELEVEKAVEEATASRTTKVKRSSMKLGPYNGFSGELRVDVDWKIKVAVALKMIPEAKSLGCSLCQTTEGRIDFHNEDYSRPFQTVAICQKHHMALHNRFRSPGYARSWQKVVAEYGDKASWIKLVAS